MEHDVKLLCVALLAYPVMWVGCALMALVLLLTTRYDYPCEKRAKMPAIYMAAALSVVGFILWSMI